MITSTLLITIIVAILLYTFRIEVRKLVDWVISFKRLAKTSEGFSIETTRPDVRPMPDERHDQTTMVTDVIAEPVRLLPAPQETESSRKEGWVEALIDKRYDDAFRILEADWQKETVLEKQLLLKSAAGYVRFEEDAKKGAAYFEELIREFPDRYQPYEWFALSYYWRGLYERALAVADRGLQKVKEKARLWDVRTDCLTALGRDADAIVAATNGIESDPTGTYNYINLAQIYDRKQDIATARSWYKRGLEATHGNTSLLRAYANFLSDKGLKEEAVLRYTELVNRDPNNPELLTLLGNAYLGSGLNNHALEAYKKADTLADKKQGWIRANIGNLYKNKGFYGEAIEHLKEALNLEPDSQYAHERLAQAQKLQEQESENLAELLRKAKQAEEPKPLTPPSSIQ